MDTQVPVRTIEEFAAAVRLSRAKIYALPPELQPRSAKVGRRRLVTESPQGWIERYAQATAPTGAAA